MPQRNDRWAITRHVPIPSFTTARKTGGSKMMNDPLTVPAAPLAVLNPAYRADSLLAFDAQRGLQSRRSRGSRGVIPRPQCATTRQVLKLMERHVERPLTLAQLAASVDVSPRQVQRLFKQHLNTTPQACYLKVRIHKARSLLRNTHGKVLDIAQACGFVSPNHFSRHYKALFGFPPSHERRLDG